MLTFLITMLVTFTFGLERPNLCIAQGLVESGMNQYAVGGNGKWVGAFQVTESIWGKVPPNLFSQAKQNESIINDLHNGDMHNTVKRYNGWGADAEAYADKVRRTALELELLYTLI